ncbi:hypothetical protein [Paenibacillus sophorae]|uniref:Uncharacterized protein n=1 Tax=Paenibacillus sophorae TaxID=1333845 RepID=A0ABX8H7M3_9BACL|nr:hypothetical protein [Paenibacillus sophorae]QWU14215.1 hypothetical protein KP014_20090 [Paenibacillus sophorae]
MKLSEAAKTILSICWVNEKPRSTNFTIGEKYIWQGKEFKATEDTYEELVEYQEVTSKPFKMNRTGKSVVITGGRLK